VTLDGVPLTGWRATPLDVAELAAATLPDTGSGPAAWRAEFTLERPGDLFLDTDAWSKGYAFVNGFFLGRYWRNGPTRTLYVPAPVTRSGANALVVLELEQLLSPVAAFVATPSLGAAEE
jgi:beta-galactosidase